jgi:hypothetical protein
MPSGWRSVRRITLTSLLVTSAYVGAAGWQSQGAAPASSPQVSPEKAALDRYCVRCHNEKTASAGLVLDTSDLQHLAAHGDVWEKVVRKMRARAMPPAGAPRPDERGYSELLSYLESTLDRAAKTNPDPGRTDPFRRLNRTEYRNAVRDVLDLEVDVADLLPRDDASYGFDNVSVAGLSPTLMERYLNAAQKVSRLAVGSPVRVPGSRMVVLPPDLTQEAHLEGLPFGTRGGMSVTHTFPVDGEYTLRVRLSRDRNENVEGLTEPHEIEVMLDDKRLQLFTVTPNRNRFGQYYSDEGVDKHLELRVPVAGGPHTIAVAFVAKNSALVETERQPYEAHFNADRHPRVQPALRSISIDGPFVATGVGATPSRNRIFVCKPSGPAEEAGCAKTIVSNLARRAYRRPVTGEDLKAPLAFYREGRADGGFEAGIEMALRALLTSTEFLFRIERDPDEMAPGTAYKVSDVALASRLSFFLWSSPPDDELLGLAERRQLSDPATLERQVRRMLADSRSESLTTNFASQWLHLRNLTSVTPDARLFPDFDANLRQGFRRETELLFESIVKEDRNVTDLLTANYTFLNERLAKHYGVPNIYGDHFRRVPLADNSERAGLLGHGSILTVTSYANRTSPVLRGKWILENILGMPPPPPPPNVPPLEDKKPGGKDLSMRDRMVQHRANPACASCHQLMDPAGLSMENFDAIGRWRMHGDGGPSIDAAGSLPGGSRFDGVSGLRQALVARPDLFAMTISEKLLTYGLGRGVDYRDAPAVREIVRDAAGQDYRFSSVVLAIVRSAPFQMRRSE